MRRERLAERLRQHLRFLSLSPLISVSLNHVCFLFPQRCSEERIWSTLKEDGVSLAMGQAYAGIEGVQRSYREALSLLTYLSPNMFLAYESLLLPRVLMGDKEAQSAFLEKLLGGLKKQRNGEVLCETLLAWAQAGFHLTNVARALNIHPKTLRYRLTRASELEGLDLTDPDTRFRLQLASHLLSLKHTH